MANRIKGITIELDGDTTGLDKALQSVNKRSRELQSELREVDRALKFNPENTELIAQKQKILSEQIEVTKNKLDSLKNAEKQVQEQFQKGDIKEEQYRAFQREIIETTSKLNYFESKLKETEKKVDSFGESFKEAQTKIKDAGEKMKSFGTTLTTHVTAPLVTAFGLVTKGTEDLREGLAMLETNAKNVGVSAETMNDALVRLSGVSEETDSNIEALSNLLQTGFDEQGMLQALDALSGAVIRFPDTLKIESLADGLQETLATGQATGTFAELLERSGMVLDDFNAGLEQAIANGSEQNYVLETLAKTGLAEVNEAYRQNNEDLVASRESTMSFQMAIAELGDTLVPIITAITDAVTPMVQTFNDMDPTGQKVILVLLGIAAAIGPLIVMLGTLSMAFSAISLPVLAVIGVITALIAAGVALYKNWDKIKEAAGKAWDWIGNKIQQVADFIGEQVERIKNFFANLKIKLPEFKLPHFRLEGKFDLIPPDISVPTLKVDWYAQGGLFPANSPQIIGVGDNKTSPEAVLPLNDEVLGTIAKGIASFINVGSGVTVNVENFNNNTNKDIRTLAQELAFYMKQQGAFD